MAESGISSPYRLARTALPVRYDLELAPDLETLTFSGSERVEIEVSDELGELVLNADELSITDATITRSGEDELMPLEVVLEQELERVHFVPAATLSPGRYTLSCHFSGVFNDLLTGFYRSRYVDDDGVEHTIATTHFEETDARKAFPCFDEPDMKAVFGVTLIAPPGAMAVSNAKLLAADDLEGGARRFRFADTIKMSSYLAAFVVGSLDATEWIDVDGTAIRVVHVPGKGGLTATALDVAAHALRYFNDYYDIDYPGDKLELVAMPDFASGAMENLGCVIFREADLLADPVQTSLTEKIRVAEVIEHEIAHMWFGDLVTMRWWNGVWLNEAFATFMQVLCQTDYRPQWNSFVSFARLRTIGLVHDGMTSTRPIEFPVESPDDAAAMFDPPITYYKGGSVLWMIERFLGHDGFRKGVRRYLKENAYSNTETSDLWDALEAENRDVPVRQLMDSWIFQGGHPIVSVSQGAPGTVELAQAPFSYLPAEDLHGRDSQIGHDWLLPVIIGSLADPSEKARLVLRSGSESVQMSAPVLVNAGGSGFYRVIYEPALLGALLPEMARLDPIERLDLVSDSWATVQAGLSEVGDFLDVVGLLAGESNPFVWTIAVGALRTIFRLAPESDLPVLAAFVRQTLRPELDRLGWQRQAEEDEGIGLLRGVLIGALGTIGDDPDVLARARELFATDRNPGQEIDADLAAGVLSTVAAHASAEDFATLVERFRTPRFPLDGIRHEMAFASLTDLGFAAQVLEMCRNEIRSQDAPYLLLQMMHQRAIGPTTWEFVADHFDELVSKYPASSIDRMLEGMASLADLDDAGEPRYLDAAAKFVDANIHGGIRRVVDQTLELLEVNVHLAKRLRSSSGALLAARLTR